MNRYRQLRHTEDNSSEESDDDKGYGGSASSSELSDEESEEPGEEQLKKLFHQYSQGSWGIPVGTFPKALKRLGLEKEGSLSADEDDNGFVDLQEFNDRVNFLLVEQARASTLKAADLIKKVRRQILVGDFHGLGEATESLHDHWKRITVDTFLRWFQAMGQDPSAQDNRVEMLNSLIFTVPANSFKGQTGKEDHAGVVRHTSFGRVHGDLMVSDSVVVKFSSQTLPLYKNNGEGGKLAVDFRRRRQNCIEDCLLGNVREKYLLAYFTLPLLQREHIHKVVQEIERASVDSKVFSTPIVTAILTEGWHTAQPVFYLVLLLDFCVIVCLSIFATDARNQQIPSRCSIFSLFCISSVFFVNEAYITVTRCRSRKFFDSFWSFYEMMVTIYFFMIMVIGIIVKRDLWWRAANLKPTQETWLYDHAIWVEFLVLLKTTHFAIKLLCVRALGERVIPAYCALKHKSSLGLLVFLFVLYCNACLTFHAVPIHIYDPDEQDTNSWDYWENWFDSCMLQFRLAFLGESEPDELEGDNKRLRLSVPELNVTTGNSTWEGKILDPSTHTQYHHGVQVTNVIFLILIHILVLNVYIGVLSQEYNNYVKKEREHFEKFRAFFIGKQIFWASFWSRLWRLCRRRTMNKGATTWIAYKHSVFPDPFDEDPRKQERLREVHKLFQFDLTDEERTDLLRTLVALPRRPQ